MKVGSIQMKVSSSKEENLRKAEKLCRDFQGRGTDLLILPEMFNCPYEVDHFSEFAEPIPGPSTERLARVARDMGIYLIGGSIPERSDDQIFNTSPVFDPEGNLIGKHRKIHLFDVNIPDGITFRESDSLAAGDCPTVIDTELGTLGLAICYDLRFPELIRTMTLANAKIIVFPAAFNTTTGPAHWKTLLRARAIDNQVFVFAVSPARNPESSYRAYGHSMSINPWGKILKEGGHSETTFSVEIDLQQVREIRRELPVLSHRRPELYEE